jgi:aminoglycoside/choline kinase family phosphotransferase
MREQTKVERDTTGDCSRGEGADNDWTTHLMTKTLEEGLSKKRGQPVHLRELHREFLSSSSSFRTERLRVSLEGRKAIPVFFKDLNPEHQMEKARAVRAEDLEPSLRELRMYQSVLSPESFGTPHLYAHRWEPDRGLYWIFLEDGGRTVLHNFLDMPRWTAAARWAARFHAGTRLLPDTRTSFVPRWDETHYRGCADRVREILPNLPGQERELVSRGLDCYTERIDWLSARPRSVIHGQFFGKNILLRRAGAGHRIVVIDWETAALGPGTFDLVSLTSGKWTTEQRHAMRTAYLEQYEIETGSPVDRKEFSEELAVVTLHQSLEWLAWWGNHRNLSRHFANFLKELGMVLDEHFAPAQRMPLGPSTGQGVNV